MALLTADDTVVVEAASSSSWDLDPRRCSRSCRHRRRCCCQSSTSRRYTSTRGRGGVIIINDSTLVKVLVRVVVVAVSVAALAWIAPPLNLNLGVNLSNNNLNNLIVGVEAVVELRTTMGGALGGFKARVDSKPALFGRPFGYGESYESYLYLPPGDDRDKFLCSSRGRRRRRRHLRGDENNNNERNLVDLENILESERREAMEEAAADLYHAVTGMEPPDINISSKVPMRSLTGTHNDNYDLGADHDTDPYIDHDSAPRSNTGSHPPAPPPDLPLALLVSRGGDDGTPRPPGGSSGSSSESSCSFEAKARNAMALNDVFHAYAMAAENPLSNNLPLVKVEYLIVHDSLGNTEDFDRLVSMEPSSSYTDDIDLRLVFVSTRSGIVLRRAIEDDAKARHAHFVGGSGGLGNGNGNEGGLGWRQELYLNAMHLLSFRDRPPSTWRMLPPPVVKIDGAGGSPSQGGNDNNDQPGSGNDNDNQSSSITANLSLAITYVLFAVLAAAVISRLMMLWFEGGGHIRFRRNPDTHRIVGLRVVSAERGWWRGAARRDLQAGDGMGGGGQEGEDKDKMSTEEVMALPEIEYRGCADVDVEDPTAAGGSSLLLSSGESGSLRRLSTSLRRISSFSAFSRASSPSSATRRRASASSALFLASSSPVAASPRHSSATIEGTAAAAATIEVADDNSDDKEQAQEEEEISSKTCCTACSICIDDFERGEKVRLLPRCRHAFHTDCILPWLTERQGCCPLCKTRVLLREDTDKEQHEDEDEEQNQEEERDIVVESSSEEEEDAVELVELPRTSQPGADDDDSGASIAIRIGDSAGYAESGENDGIFQGG